MGTVYRAVDETLHRDVAIKVLNTELTDPDALRRFKAEAVAIARLNHPGIAKIFELFQHNDQWLMAIEFVQGETLEQLIGRSGPMPVDRAVDLTQQALDALDHAHRMSVVHRDLKPANLMVAANRLKVTDFGIARVAGSEHLTSAGLRMGTPGYMAPEQVMGEETDARADIFAMACVLYYLVSARLPFEGETPLAQAQARMANTATPLRTHRPDLPVWLDNVLAKALERAPARRFQTANEFRDALSRGLEGKTITVPEAPQIPAHLMETALPGSMPVAPVEDVTRASHTPPVRPVPARGGVRNILIAAIAIVAIGGTLLWLTSRGGADQTAPPPTPSPSLSPSATPVASPTPAPTTTPVVTSTPVATGTPVTTATPVTTGTPVATTPGATPTPTPGARGATAADTPVSFDVKAFNINGRRGEEMDAALTITGGALSVSFKGPNPLVQTYKGILAATFIRDRNPRWSTALASPPSDLDLSGGIMGVNVFRRQRNWLVLQGKTWYVILALPDDRAESILSTLQQRTHVKIDRPAPAK
jgi:serine/threonine-protein kinase